MARACLTLLCLWHLTVPQIVHSDDRLPAYLIRLPESVSTVFVAETSTDLYHRFDNNNGVVRYGGNHYMSIGREGVGKERSGDRRTPLGAYFVTEELDTTRMHEKYGSRAFPLDYPNAWDQRLGRTGSDIWVHGMDPRGGKRPSRDTDGCIALLNEDLDALANQFEDNVTPVLVTRELEWSESSSRQQMQNEIETAVDHWALSVESGDLYTYLSQYADDFERWGMRKPQWSSFSLQSIGERPIDRVVIDDLLVLGYPDVEGLYLSRFRLTVIEGRKESESIKRLYWRRDQNGVLRILAEDSG